APSVTRAAILRDPAITAGIGQWGAIQTAAPSLGLETSPLNVRDASEIERAVTAFARSPNGGLVVTGSAVANIHRNLIITLATRHRLPAVYFERFFVTAGGLIPTGLIFSTSTGVQPPTSIASSKVSSRPTCRCRRPPSTYWQSISRPPGRSASPYRTSCS